MLAVFEYVVPFVLFLAAELWILSKARLPDIPDGPWARVFGVVLIAGMLAGAGIGAWAVNAAPRAFDCPTGYDKQGPYADC